MIHFDPIPPVSACRLHLQRKNQVRMVLPLKLTSEMLVLVACKTNHDSFRSNSACVRLSPARATQNQVRMVLPLKLTSEMLVLVACKTNHDSFRSNSACVRLSPAPATQKPSSYGAALEIDL